MFAVSKLRRRFTSPLTSRMTRTLSNSMTARLETGRQREIDEDGHALLGLDRLILRLHVAHRAAEPDHLARDRVPEQREIRRLAVGRPLDQARARSEVNAQQLAQLAARPGRQ